MQPDPGLDKFRRREIEQQLTANLQAASERLRRSITEEEKRTAREVNARALQRFTDFVTKGVVPEDLLSPEPDSKIDE
jgi:hypothetical protein